MASSQDNINSVLNEAGLYVPGAKWFELLQDAGKEMTAAERTEHLGQSKKRWTRKVAHIDRFYPKLYTLASEVHDRLQAHNQYFPNLAKLKPPNIHAIGKFIATRRTLKSRADLHSLPDGFDGINLTTMPEYENVISFYLLPQREVLLFCSDKYSSTTQDLKKSFTLDDKVRTAGICFCEAGVREFLQDMLGKSKGGDRGAIDASRSRKSAGFIQLHQKFTDTEVIVPIPEEWDKNETRIEIDSLLKICSPTLFFIRSHNKSKQSRDIRKYLRN